MSVHDHLHCELDDLASMLRQRAQPSVNLKDYHDSVLHAEAEVGWESLLALMLTHFRADLGPVHSANR